MMILVQVQLTQIKSHLNGKEIDLTSEDISINSTNFSVDKDGNMECVNGKFNGIAEIIGGTTTNPKMTITTSKYVSTTQSEGCMIVPNRIWGFSGGQTSFWITNSSTGSSFYMPNGGEIWIRSGSNETTINQDGIITPQIYKGSLNYEVLACKTLYESLEGTNGTVTLSESVDEYKKIEILVQDAGGEYLWKTFTVLEPSEKYITTDIISINSADITSPRINTRTLYISGNKITVENSCVNYIPNGTYQVNEQKIFKVIGYK